MRTRTLELWILVVLSFVITIPGAVAFANWDAPYGFSKDLATWMSCAGSALIFVILYGVYEWRKGSISLKSLVSLVFVWIITILVGLTAQSEICGQMGYRCGFSTFILAGFPGLFLSLMLFPMALSEILVGGAYPYDRPLVVVWYILLAVVIFLSIVLYKQKKREKAHGTG
ncbi:hypothetical protein [Thermococcus stetteri]|uniref:hypothetical protein n=1 Tax=Thermococcus stetteri TaxID=49900 RepID=UPI001AE459B6|nr:hypothetical protein [Thermococcus stetteri]MBP1912612.1 putative solute:sodium symporter small subunit [Thermococcus stetteri]